MFTLKILFDAEFPNIILNIEKTELGISAGLQDRVVQTYGGLVHMDFTDCNRRVYTELDATLLPKFYLIYNTAAGLGRIVPCVVAAAW